MSKENSDENSKSSKSKDHQSKLLIELFHSQTKQIVGAVLALTRQNETDSDSGISSIYQRPSSPINDREQMQLVKNIAVAVRDLLQTLDYAPNSIKEMVKLHGHRSEIPLFFLSVRTTLQSFFQFSRLFD